MPRRGLIAHHRLFFLTRPDLAQIVPDDALSAVKAVFTKFFMHPHASNIGILFQKCFDHGFEGIQLAFSRMRLLMPIMANIALFVVVAQDPPDRVAAHIKIPRQGTNAPALGMHENDLMFQFLTIANKDYHRLRCPCIWASTVCIRSMTGETRAG